MKQIKNFIFLFLVLFISSCHQHPINNNGLVGELNEVFLDHRSCLENPLQPEINEKIAGDFLIDSVKIQVLSYDFFEMQAHSNSPKYSQRIDISGITNEGKIYKAILRFNECDKSYQEPELLDKSDLVLPIIKLYYPKSKLNSILNILEEKQSVMIHFHSWEKSGAWCAISYHSVSS